MSALSAKRIVVTRASHQAAEMADLLTSRGAESVLYPCIEIAPPEDTRPLDAALQNANTYDWLVLTSTNTVFILKQRLDRLGLALPPALKVAAVGSSTARAARDQLNVEVGLIPEKFIAESLAEALQPASGTRILLPQADIARPILAQSLIAAGATVKAVEAYRTVIGTGGANVPAMLADHQIDAITFTSPSTARNFMIRLSNEGGDIDTLNGVCIAAIGTVTAEALREVGLNIDVVPDQHTLIGLVEALDRWFTLK